MDTLRVYMGYDARDALAFQVASLSIRKHTKTPVTIIPLYDWELRHRKIYWRSYRVEASGQRFDDRDGKPFSTDFSFTRFCVPFLEDYGEDWVLFVDPDVMFRADIAELFDLIDPDKAVMCIKHQHHPNEIDKMAGLMQTHYRRKNWSSLMLMKPDRCSQLTPFAINNSSGGQLHAMTWIDDDLISALPEAWNWLEGSSDPKIDPKMVHYTRGTPDLPGYNNVAFADEWREHVARLT